MKEIPTENGSVDDGEATNEYGAIDHGVDEKKVGFSLEEEYIEEASGVPAEEKEQILAVFNAYMDTFNEKDIDGYLDTLVTRKIMILKKNGLLWKKQFSEYELNREVSNVTIVKYSEQEAQVFAKLEDIV